MAGFCKSAGRQGISLHFLWYHVAMARIVECVECRAPFESLGSRGRTPRFCSPRCRTRAHRAKRPRSTFPKGMIEVDRWARADGKRPVMPNGRPASSTNSSTWSPYTDVQEGLGNGMGFMLGDGFACLDLDGCIDDQGRLSTFAKMVVGKNPDAFIERSMSGTGLHIFGRLPAQRGRKLAGVEVYSMARFIRTTGDVFQGGGLVPLKF